jgi:hypothetical protein
MTEIKNGSLCITFFDQKDGGDDVKIYIDGKLYDYKNYKCSGKLEDYCYLPDIIIHPDDIVKKIKGNSNEYFIYNKKLY